MQGGELNNNERGIAMIELKKTTIICAYIESIEIGRGCVTDGRMHSVYVAEGNRNQGIGSEIVNALIAEGGKSLFVAKKNKGAIKFFEKSGFEKVSDGKKTGYVDMRIKDG